MRLVMTLLVRDEADIVDAQLAFHLAAGVDFVVATDHRSQDGTTEILRRYEREGVLRLLRVEDAAYKQAEWVTRMARLAATEHGADWVIHADADEFFWPRGGDLKEVLAAIPPRYGIVRAYCRNFLPRPGEGPFYERMVVRLTPHAPITDPRILYRPNEKVVHRGDPTIRIGQGNHRVMGSGLQLLHGWYPLEVLHFPIRSLEQCERKNLTIYESLGERRRGDHIDAVNALRSGRLEEYYQSLVVDDEELERGLAEGTLAIDTRLRDALRAIQASEGRPAKLRFPRPSVVEEAAYAVDVAVLGETDIVRAQRRLEALEQRLAALERRPSARLVRALRRVARRS
jgi:hypothetical protein